MEEEQSDKSRHQIMTVKSQHVRARILTDPPKEVLTINTIPSHCGGHKVICSWLDMCFFTLTLSKQSMFHCIRWEQP